MKNWFDNTLVEKLNLLSNLLDDEGLYCINNKLSLADVVLYSLLTQFFDNKEGSMKAASSNGRIINIINTVGSIEEVQNWLQKRPNTVF